MLDVNSLGSYHDQPTETSVLLSSYDKRNEKGANSQYSNYNTYIQDK